ncbi:hypothetical protein MKI79_09110 [Acinetobacter sp. A3.8]|uniref:Uncharacterized protein n=1 Tax=Acinetobacter sedimenti TaxID=2919922 RepID=A0A9X1WZP4_9GAMM|nr:hypothetical protein [Acinetobacter sedimenti]MCJ8147057.1 hypothetical protein [Acinetobacter sedimenti]
MLLKKSIKTLSCFALIFLIWGGILAFLYWMTLDDPLSQVAQDFLAIYPNYQPDLKEHPYFLELGFDAKKDIDPMVLGRLRYHAGWAEWYQTNLERDKWKEHKLTENVLLDNDLDQQLTAIFEADSRTIRQQPKLNDLLPITQEVEAEYKNKQYLIDRYKMLVYQGNLENSELLLPITCCDMSWLRLRSIQYLYLSHLILNQDIEQLHLYANELTTMLSNRNDMIEKAVLIKQIDTVVNIIHLLEIENPQRGHELEISLEPLGNKSFSIRRMTSLDLIEILSFLSEERMNAIFVELEEESTSLLDLLNTWKGRLIFKQIYKNNMTANLYAEWAKTQINWSESNYVDYVRMAPSGVENDHPKLDASAKFRNQIGAEILETLSVDRKRISI